MVDSKPTRLIAPPPAPALPSTSAVVFSASRRFPSPATRQYAHICASLYTWTSPLLSVWNQPTIMGHYGLFIGGLYVVTYVSEGPGVEPPSPPPLWGYFILPRRILSTLRNQSRSSSVRPINIFPPLMPPPVISVPNVPPVFGTPVRGVTESPSLSPSENIIIQPAPIRPPSVL